MAPPENNSFSQSYIPEKKITLLNALKAMKKALVSNTIYYDWDNLATDNVGLLAQCITRTDKKTLFEEYLSDLYPDDIKNAPTWSQLLADYWPMTGTPTCEIFQDMCSAGLKRQDIYNLEYLTGEIAEESQIMTTTKTVKAKVKQYKKVGIWPFKKKIEETVEKNIEIKHYEHKTNLVRYIDTWITRIEDVENVAKSGGFIMVDGEKYSYKNSLQLEKLKKHFLSLEDYRAVKIVQDELDKFKK